jgi:flotillin
MIMFFIALFGLIFLTLIIQLLSKMKIIGGNELGIISGKNTKKGFTTISGGRAFIVPLFNRFEKINLTPYTIEVLCESAIAAGIVPLNVKATVSFAISSSKAGREKAVTRILRLSQNQEKLCELASSIIEGHLRDAVASLTPEQVMKDKDKLVANMINVCKSDLENIGLEITTMNIADVDDHRLSGVVEPNLYIDLLKRIQTTNAKCQARIAKANADATSIEQEQERRAETEVRKYENLYENLVAETRVKVAVENQRKTVGVEQALKNADAQVAGLISEIESEKQRIGMLEKKFEAEIITSALAQKEKMILDAKAAASRTMGVAQGEIDKLKETIDIISNKDRSGAYVFIIENFENLITPFAETMSLFPVDNLTVITGTDGKHDPISAIHPNAIDDQKNKLIYGAIAKALGLDEEKPVEIKENEIDLKNGKK